MKTALIANTKMCSGGPSAPSYLAAAAAAEAASSAQPTTTNNKVAGTKRKLQPPIVQQTQNIILNGDAAVTKNQPMKQQTSCCSNGKNCTNNSTSNSTTAPRSPTTMLDNDDEMMATDDENDDEDYFDFFEAKFPLDVATMRHHMMRNAALQRGGDTDQSAGNQRLPKPPGAANSARPPPTLPDSIEGILEYIEGGTSRKDMQKKAAKKAKQKQKRQDLKKVEQLEDLRDEFHDAICRESYAKTELKQLKSAKKKDKKKIGDAEGMLRKSGKLRTKFEGEILEIIGEIKRHNGEFKFSYLPSKEQIAEKHQKIRDGKPTMMKTVEEKPVLSSSSSPSLNAMQPNSDEQQQQQQKNVTTETSSSTDPTKRMVTIRRVNMPHSDPQVTVTAKGPSPDKDKLLYTFINGQLVSGLPAGNDAEFKAQSISQVQQYHLQHQQLRQQNLNAALNNAAAAATVPAGAASTKVDGGEAVASADSNNSKKKSKKENKNPSPLAQPIKAAENIGKQKNTPKKLNNVEYRKSSIDDSCSVDTTSTNKSKNGKKVSTINQITRMTKDLNLSKKNEKRKVKAPKYEYADPQYKNNKFDVLDLDDDDYYISEDDSSVPSSPSRRSSPVTVAEPITTKSMVNETAKSSLKITNVAATKSAPAAVPAKTTETKSSSYAAAAAGRLDKNSSKSKNNSPAVILLPPPPPPPPELSKKQKKKLAQQQLKQENAATKIGSSSKKAQNAAALTNTLKDSMQRLSLNDDTTIELVRDSHAAAFGGAASLNPSVSIMDQLNRGIKVEGLTLPPGITLTRVDPIHAEQVRAKKESIVRVSFLCDINYIKM